MEYEVFGKMKELCIEIPGEKYVKKGRRDHEKCNYSHII